MRGQMMIPGVSNNKERLTAFIHWHRRSGPHVTASLLLQTLSLKAFPPLLGCFFSSHTLPNQASSWGKPLRGPHVSMASLCSLCTQCTNAGPQRPPRGHPIQVCGLQLSKGMCWLSTLNYNLTWSKNKNTVMCIFFPEMIIIVLQTSTTKMEKALQKIIY